ncbi:uncharacterized protein HD556DRAFT_1310895 [Suillus plorans]|uniref:BAH domain-containing protein n=1 Tax=Suillus plorans TaxID=116603 RepID=A0A9P7AJF9_9AGAM|nr:uncharacterized protein HD556DRAFT_1310895 [Suillus plorans]KAG1790111.1 hypothetical protein HD556DRAFT_1310895 [Suillus plorans]
MRGSQPNTRRLRTWVYSTEDDSCATNDLNRLILRVGESVAIFPDDARAVTKTDGSLPIMSYCLIKDVWLDIQWYYRRVDLEDAGVDLAESIGEYELVLSDHISLVDMMCIEDHATIIKYDECNLAQHPVPPETPYHRWNVTIKFARHRKDVNIDDALELHTDQVPESKLPATYDGIQLEEDFVAILIMPICRGGPYGVVGNGWIYSRARSLLKEVRVNGKLPNGWKASLTETDYEGSEVEIRVKQVTLITENHKIFHKGCLYVMRRYGLYFVPSMDPFFRFRHWSSRNARTLMKSKGTIEDVDGECLLKVFQVGRPSESGHIAAHYRVPLRAVNKKFGIYRKIVTHLTSSSQPLASQLRDTYLSIMEYMHNVRITFCADARGSPDPLQAGFRSAALDYYLWLDHRAGGFHELCRAKIEQSHKVTFKSVQNRECQDIISFLDWGSYHTANCNEHDICGAFQGYASEEDLQCLLDAVDVSMDSSQKHEMSSSPIISRVLDTDILPTSVTLPMDNIQPLLGSVDTPMYSDSMTVVDSTDIYTTLDDIFTFPDITPLGFEPERSLSLTVGHALDTANQSIPAIHLMQEDIQPLSCSVHTAMEPIVCPQDTESMIVVDSTNIYNAVDDTFAASYFAPPNENSMLNIGQATDDSTRVSSLAKKTNSSGSVLKPFPLPFDWGYCKRAIGSMGVPSIRVDLSRWLIAHIVVRIRELYGLDEDTPLDDAIQHGSECQATYEEFHEISGMFKFLRAIQAIAEERQTIADFFVCAARGPHLSDMRIECGVQCDIESQLDPGDMGTDTAHITSLNCSLTHDYETNTENVLPSEDHNDCSTDQSHISIHTTEPLFTMDSDNQSAAASTPTTVNIADCQSQAPTIYTTQDNHSDPPSDHDTVPRTRLRARNVKKVTCATVPTQKRRHENSVSQHDVVKDRPRTGRPVIFAGPLVQPKKKARTLSPGVNYTIEDLIKGLDSTTISPSIHLFLLDPMRDDFIQKNTASQYNSLLNIARFIASALTTKSLSDSTITAAASLMKIEFWLEDVALDCKVALEAKDMSLSPLAHHVLVELSTRALEDASSLTIALEIHISVNFLFVDLNDTLLTLRVSQEAYQQRQSYGRCDSISMQAPTLASRS